MSPTRTGMGARWPSETEGNTQILPTSHSEALQAARIGGCCRQGPTSTQTTQCHFRLPPFLRVLSDERPF